MAAIERFLLILRKLKFVCRISFFKYNTIFYSIFDYKYVKGFLVISDLKFEFSFFVLQTRHSGAKDQFIFCTDSWLLFIPEKAMIPREFYKITRN